MGCRGRAGGEIPPAHRPRRQLTAGGCRPPLPPAQKIEQCPKDSSISVLAVPPGYAVRHEENDAHRRRDDQDGSHRLLPFSSTAGHVPFAVRGELDDGRRDIFGP
jgi:hypothetical protein